MEWVFGIKRIKLSNFRMKDVQKSIQIIQNLEEIKQKYKFFNFRNNQQGNTQYSMFSENHINEFNENMIYQMTKLKNWRKYQVRLIHFKLQLQSNSIYRQKIQINLK
ncbi:unnamed protein product [Paramecium octaurelia]|uniref:Uncharacterized protein n=1 Tax=Paramecium octaurelia TaxID=43137 RepID=A0A8S1YPA8_PAROT|nr:unnamed protein product [Paramecium octaurelia]